MRSEKYLDNHEDHFKVKARRNEALMKHRALWGLNKYQMERGILKGVIAPGLTFECGIVHEAGDTIGVEVNQRAVGRLALGAHIKRPMK